MNLDIHNEEPETLEALVAIRRFCRIDVGLDDAILEILAKASKWRHSESGRQLSQRHITDRAWRVSFDTRRGISSTRRGFSSTGFQMVTVNPGSDRITCVTFAQPSTLKPSWTSRLPETLLMVPLIPTFKTAHLGAATPCRITPALEHLSTQSSLAVSFVPFSGGLSLMLT